MRPLADATANRAAGPDSLGSLRAAAQKDPKGAIKEAARQFEALFMQELMKSMRSTTLASGMMDNGTSEMATGMLDTHYATQMSGRPGGLADAIARQLERQMGTAAQGTAAPTVSMGARLPSTARAAATAAEGLGAVSAFGGKASQAGTAAERFVQRHQDAAARVAAQSGIPAGFMLGQAAHETGWGRRDLIGTDGRNAHNLFGIKAGGSWNGPVVEAATTEVIDGRAVKVKARFRAYSSYEESFRDYARLIGNSPRYAGVMQASGDAHAFAQNLQKAGYATDPQYAAKLSRVIDTAMRLQQRITT